MKVLKKFYRLTVWSHYEEDGDEPYTVDYNSMDEALNARYQYDNELTFYGSHAYSTCGPEVVEAYVDVEEETK